MISKSFFSLIFLLSATVVSWLASGGIRAAHASQSLQVRVLDRHSGTAIPDAAVCLGTGANPSQFGVGRTDLTGAASFNDLLSDALLVTVSRQGFQGRAQRIESLTQSRVLLVKVVPGGGGPHCDAPTGEEEESLSSGLEIDGVSIRKAQSDPTGVLLSVVASAPANQVRISEHANFAGASWQAFQQPVLFNVGPGQARRDIYVQIRRYVESQGATIEVISPVKRVRYRP
jgi:hypothetical protein